MAPRRVLNRSNGIEIRVYTKSVMIDGKILFLGDDPDRLKDFMPNLMCLIDSIYTIGYNSGVQHSHFYSADAYKSGRQSRDHEIQEAYNKGRNSVTRDMEGAYTRGRKDHADFVRQMLSAITKP